MQLAQSVARSVLRSTAAALASAVVTRNSAERPMVWALRALGTTRLGRAVRSRVCAQIATAARARELDKRWARTPNGAWLQIDPAGIFAPLFLGGEYEGTTTKAFTRLLSRGDVFVDVGANVGYFSMLAAQIVGPAGTVVAVEPNPNLLPFLHASVARNGYKNVNVLDVALSDFTGEVDLLLSTNPANDGISSIAPWKGHLESGDLSYAQSVRVRCRRLDGVAEVMSLPRIDLMKIDVEGAELAALRGMEALLARTPPNRIICETALRGEVTGWLADIGYTATPLEFLRSDVEWGNILYERTCRSSDAFAMR